MQRRKNARTVATLGIMAAVIVVAVLIDNAYSLGLVALGGAKLAVCSLIAVTLVAMLYNKFLYAIAAGAIFGVTSFVLAYIFPSPIFQNPLASVLPRLFIGVIGFGAYRLAGYAAKALGAAARLTRIPGPLAIAVAALGAGGVVTYIILLNGVIGSVTYFVLMWLLVLAELFLAGFAVACMIVRAGKGGERAAQHFALSLGSFFTVVANTALVLPMMVLVSDSFGSLAEVYATLMLINFLPELLATTILSPFVIMGVRKGLRLDTDGRPRRKRASSAFAETESAGRDVNGGDGQADNVKEKEEEN